MSDFQLTITPIKLSDLPSEETIVSSGRALLDSTSSWKPGKAYQKGVVKTCSRPKGPQDGAPWHCRVSEHAAEDATFDEFWSKLGVDKAQNEMQYIPDIKKVTLVKQISPTQAVWSLYYTFPPPVSPRVFTVLQTTYRDDNSPRTGLIVSIPIDLSGDEELAKMEEKGVKGRYVSIERLVELDSGKVEWRMATSSTPGGKIPSFMAESTMDSTISKDVTHFLHWFHSVRSKPEQPPASG
ncbi:uncharacterized protein LAESUDRAFT_722611 [Laetiporus sulphureus 93-53]|uniref:DUF3074 domain-containing protein n=1 Tax=Laetiporus sulphureus 93-53 TaxID=1314785 RepID=A0A165FZZ8_9APHY|nr:uncharacterized protein LAESUDRAFT_722611 [Laetiporus sulphureus 93-53]KZT09643.1 hypothetical protein LAESUDRAFT_722611 [Laetiporus sulphureus 93-53]